MNLFLHSFIVGECKLQDSISFNKSPLSVIIFFDKESGKLIFFDVNAPDNLGQFYCVQLLT